jgi:hypothetical protein
MSRRPPSRSSPRARARRLTWCATTTAALLSGAAHADDADPESPWLAALSSTYLVLDTSTGDLDGDGRDETVGCYRKDPVVADRGSGVFVLAGKGVDARPVFHVQLAGTLCEKARVSGNRLGILLRGNKQLAFTMGKEMRFRGDKQSPVAAKAVTATTSLGSSNAPARAYDNDLATSWAEGSPGTGLGQSITIRLENAVDVGAVGLFCGDGNGTRPFLDKNRVHRGSIETKTAADLGDEGSGVDFSSLGIATIGDRVEFNCENKPQVTYVSVGKRDVVELSVRIDSVYLGDKKDDTHIAEIEIVPLLDPSQTVERAKDLKKKADESSSATDALLQVPGVDVDTPTKQLDGESRSIVPDDDL